ncbi:MULTISPECIES: GntR family transcriptional regulator [unclassified Rhodococcus (in: high G+C Gram-positive bacteria)]|uniref:GntR family transcriptional regulator n=1 Tax=unclassified Rhodococcus (in: high G+C Gram-positive bacteria) TaxID=192944 RepID=UPI00163ABA0F|nr:MULTISPECIES: GntR family transcriptional regulator [unclassified Rhodococcus (in: high G+C Gram-positive bacteria)]MBC2641005.1 GntR family transcriptional regulator [Rhodococcus sp. 3A]MBC2894250.1 GntR family transcriptional regulator [Rhodococcus sp. 4CII]
MVEARSRHEFVALQLRQRIMQRRYAVGESLPSESMLCAEFEVSRGPVRQALATLKNEGLIQLSQGKPAVVRSHDITQTLDTFTPFSQWARRTGRTAGSRTLEISRRRVSEPAAVALGVGADDFVVEVLRVRLLDGEPTMLERSTFTDRVGSLLFEFDIDSGSITDYLTSRGVRFESMEHVLDAVAAGEADSEHLGIDPGSPLLRERRTSRDQHGDIFEYADDRYRPDLVAFSIVNARTIDPRLPADDATGG